MSAILVTGGAGFIGSHTCVELQQAGYSLVVVDNLCNSHEDVIARVSQITSRPIHFERADIRDRAAMDRVFREHDIAAVVHFAGLKAVGESVAKPLLYYDNNVCGTATLLQAMQAAGCKTLVFSSSATVYGDPHAVPIREDFPLKPTNPYGRTKLMIEDMLRDLHDSDPAWRIALLRYFNPAGAHESGLIGEAPNGIPNNLMPYVADVAAGKREFLSVFGADYPTPDGTGVRDYIHVVDLAQGHVKALAALDARGGGGLITANLGTGQGYSVLEVVKHFEAASGRKVPIRVVERRPGDVAMCYADASFAAAHMSWGAQLGLARMCEDAWRHRVRAAGHA